MRPANERRRYNVTSSLIGWAHTQNDPPNDFHFLFSSTRFSRQHFQMLSMYVYRCVHPSLCPPAAVLGAITPSVFIQNLSNVQKTFDPFHFIGGVYTPVCRVFRNDSIFGHFSQISARWCPPPPPPQKKKKKKKRPKLVIMIHQPMSDAAIKSLDLVVSMKSFDFE